MGKQLRQMKIKEILHNHDVGNQNDLIRLLDKAGIEVAQATLSRDCTELGIIRSRTHQGFRLVLPEDSPGQIIRGLVGMEVQSISSNETAIVIKTLPGRAHGVASFLDQLKDIAILGTIAGDDTVLVIPLSIKDIASIIHDIQSNLSQT
ncbi:MAG: arginine repressor [Prosthecochloris sp.]|uniref:Arginine repressor n=1 Tax=Prosthecochloris aestuarii (strain DSM 271 / SK 413) TaxID=290512 RepID=ARGR_PROA2|nr:MULTISPECIES: arginine repressor [Prosthecochloris]B4S7S0.1 RecName: Full=Arginine repressor [Prosthecochloris aestuarii DSM 271]ACF46107.1 arginine repressor, ArgR [Prosthecochloris aestuarii DSM 271]MCW8797489.1 arginine repressor [Prosthecochloris sp.]NEX12759.1 arginine repressor [Prosthecochloris sp.]RDD30354.1 arginine repressor [Prosthecochloris sp. ZM]